MTEKELTQRQVIEAIESLMRENLVMGAEIDRLRAENARMHDEVLRQHQACCFDETVVEAALYTEDAEYRERAQDRMVHSVGRKLGQHIVDNGLIKQTWTESGTLGAHTMTVGFRAMLTVVKPKEE
jgi:hypothetical protein